MAQDETDVAARLAEALTESELVHSIFIDPIAHALLPVVRKLGDLRAAEELEAAAEDLPFGPMRIRARAATLRGEAGR